jgi:thiol peroxidase
MTMNERAGELTTKGKPLTLLGDTRAVGDKAPDVTLRAADQSSVMLSDYDGKVRLISVVPSLDTGICDAQTRRFNEEAAVLGDDVVILTVSGEHPFNQRRWCGAAGVDKVIVLSDHYDMAFGNAYGTHIKEWRLNQRSIFVVDRDGTIVYREYVPEIAQFPDYDSALAAVRCLI